MWQLLSRALAGGCVREPSSSIDHNMSWSEQWRGVKHIDPKSYRSPTFSLYNLPFPTQPHDDAKAE